jgi:hypothetical protein
MRATGLLYTCLLAFAATLAYVIGARLPAETRVIALGVLTGVAVSVPTSLLVSAAATRSVLARFAAAQAAAAAAQPEPEPQYIVMPAAPTQPAPRPQRAAPVNGAQADLANLYTTPTELGQAGVPGARRFTIIGGTGQDD